MTTTPGAETLPNFIKRRHPKNQKKRREKETKRQRTKVIVSFRVSAWKLIIFQNFQQFISA
jgi:hypothetical protein